MGKGAIACSAILAAGLVLSSIILVKPSVLLKRAEGVKVKGVAVERVMSDAADWSGTIAARGPTIEAAMKLLNAGVGAARAQFDGDGVKNVEFSGARVNCVAKQKSNDIDFYEAFASLSCSMADISTARKLEESVARLLEKGVGISSGPVNYYYTKIEGLKMKLLAAASANARSRALELVRGSGSELGGVVSASQGVFQITRPLSTDVSDWGSYDVSSVEKEVKCVVTIEFSCK